MLFKLSHLTHLSEKKRVLFLIQFQISFFITIQLQEDYQRCDNFWSPSIFISLILQIDYLYHQNFESRYGLE